MKPFLLLATRADDSVADTEYEAFLKYGGLAPDELVRIRLERESMPEIDLDEYSGIIVGGGPFNATDPVDQKSDAQLRVEAEISALLDRVVARDFPFFGACYGIGTLGIHQGGVVDGTYAERAGAVAIAVTEEGATDPVLADLPTVFDAFVGHKEALSVAPPNATVLASSSSCPIQMFKIGQNIYATQFHPELDVPGIVERMQAYRHEGYFAPHELDALIDEVSAADVSASSRVIRNFVSRYASNYDQPDS